MKSLFELIYNPFAPGTIWQDKHDPTWRLEILEVEVDRYGSDLRQVKVRYLSDPPEFDGTWLNDESIETSYRPI